MSVGYKQGHWWGYTCGKNEGKKKGKSKYQDKNIKHNDCMQFTDESKLMSF